ncbi:MAG TPA: hypothetical protein VFL92_07015, partial [Sphingomonas sp.]|nr:hypothetical protein [Sphingomonas sp.]
MMGKGAVTSGGWRGMNGTQRRLALMFAGGFALILVLVGIANAESTLSEFATQGIAEPPGHVWIWEATSIAAWITTFPAIWQAVARIRPPRVSWGGVAAALVLGSLIASGWHIALMVAFRKLIYAAEGEHYRFFGIIADRLLYEYRKDVVAYAQFVSLAAVVQWALARAATPPAEPPRTLAVSDGAVTHHVPADEIASVSAAGNYVEIAWGQRTLLHRATLAAVADE